MKRRQSQPPSKIRLRKHLNGDALIGAVRRAFEKVPEHRKGTVKFSLADVAMSAFAMFSVKDPSLLAFERRWTARDHNLRTIYGIDKIPSDSSMRETLDEVSPAAFWPAFRTVFSQLQRGKALEQLAFLDGHHILSLDGTGYFSSEKLHSPCCLQKVDSRSGKSSYYLQMLGAAIVHPDFKEVIALAPELIRRSDGDTKNDCERNAAARFLERLRNEHPHLKIIITEDALSPNAPYIETLMRLDLRFILGVKPGDHQFLFQQLDKAVKKSQISELVLEDSTNPEKLHYFRYLNGCALNQSHQHLKVNVLEYWEVTPKTTQRFSWVTDFVITAQNAYDLMRAGRARWKIENETFNTLKNQGYNLEHNYGLGKKHLSAVFVTLMLLAFLVDQVQQLACPLFRAVWKKLETKRDLWERIRSMFWDFKLESLRMLLEALLYGYQRLVPVILYDPG